MSGPTLWILISIASHQLVMLLARPDHEYWDTLCCFGLGHPSWMPYLSKAREKLFVIMQKNLEQ